MERAYKKDPIVVGRVFNTTQFGLVEVLEYKNFKNVKIKFRNTGGVRWCRGDHLREGSVTDNIAPTVFGIGVRGGVTSKINGKLTVLYNTWCGMLERCYCPKFKDKYPTYKGCTVSDDWKDLRNFKVWFDKNYKVGFELDKDLLVRGNKVYSEATCVFVPVRLNNVLKLQENSRGSCMLGVHYHEGINKYISQYNNVEIKYAKSFNYEIEAFYFYKRGKEKIIKDLALKHYEMGDIDNKLFDILFSFEIEEDM